jgi:hypothetical protein
MMQNEKRMSEERLAEIESIALKHNGAFDCELLAELRAERERCDEAVETMEILSSEIHRVRRRNRKLEASSGSTSHGAMFRRLLEQQEENRKK